MNSKTTLSILLIVVLAGMTHFVYAQNKSNLPDLIIKDIFYADEPYIKVKYCNIGPVSSVDYFLIKLRNEHTGKEYPGNSYYRFKVPALGECMITGGYTPGLIALSYGEKAKVTAIIDWEGRVNESNENNNILTKTIGVCIDSDGGKNYYVKGTVTDKYGKRYTDYCSYTNSKYLLIEYYCNRDGIAGSTRYYCPNGCSDGACKPTPSNKVERWAVLVSSSADRPVWVTEEASVLKNVLVNGGWKEDHIKVLKGDDLTNESFVSAIDWLAVNSDSNDIVFLSISAHGSETSLELAKGEELFSYSKLGKELDKIKYGGFAIRLSACLANYAIPYLKKENRVILHIGQANQVLRALMGFGDIVGNKDGWVSAEEIFNFLNYSDNPEPPLIQDDYPGELNIVRVDKSFQKLDQYNMQKNPISGLIVGAKDEDQNSWIAQSFKPSYSVLDKVILPFNKINNPGPLTVSIRKDLSGPDLTSVTLSQNKFNEYFGYGNEIDFPDIQVIPGETYYIVIRAPNAVWEGPGKYNRYIFTYSDANNYPKGEDYPKGELFTRYSPSGEWFSTSNSDPYFKDIKGKFDLFFATFGTFGETCTDTDGGKNYYVKGTVTSKSGTFIDKCWAGGELTEYICKDNDVFAIAYQCPNGCKDGACVKGKEPYCSAIGTKSEGWYQYGELIKYDKCNGCYAVCKDIGTKSEGWYSSCDDSLIKYEICSAACTDTDGGKNYYVKGTATDRYVGSKTDYCVEHPENSSDERWEVIEHWCEDAGDGRGPVVHSDGHYCFYGCKDGACIRKVSLLSPNVFLMPGDNVMISDKDNYVNVAAVTKEFFKTQKDEYDFISIYTTFDPPRSQYQSHYLVLNNIKGIGLPIQDYSDIYGSNGKLKGVDFMRSIDMYSVDEEETYNALKHETGHQWLAYVGGNCDSDTGFKMIRQHIHWNIFLDTRSDNSGKYKDPMGGRIWIDNRDGTFRFLDYETGLSKENRFCPLSLYLMGLIPPEEVPDVTLIEPKDGDLCNDHPLPVEGKSKKTSIKEIINLEGERMPAWPNSQRDFKMAFILLTKPGKDATKEQKEKIKKIASKFPQKWYIATDGKSTMNAEIRKCSDTDDGKNYYVKGTVTSCTVSPGGEGVCEVFTDKCVPGYRPANAPYPPYPEQWAVKEYYCEGDEVKSVTYNCPNGCKDGACVATTTECKDSDGGKNYYVKGTCVDSRGFHTDECIHSASQHLLCKDLCGDGICQKTVCMGPNCPCPETAESCPEDCGSGSSNSQLLEWYCSWSYLENGQSCRPIKITCPNGCKDGACINISSTVVKEKVKCVFENSTEIQKCYTDDGKFGCSGIGTCIADVSGEKGTKLLWKSSCGGYAYTVIDGIDEYAEFKCVLLCKDSCPFEGKCYPFGYRKAGKFCSENGSFVKQKKSGASCDNNFECYSNICINAKCANADLIQMIIDWFRKVFGLM